jgi:hypothetical protein
MRILHLHAEERHAGPDQLAHAKSIEVRSADPIDLSRPLQLAEPMEDVEVARHRIVPPMELDEVKPIDGETAQRFVDDRFDIGLVDRGEPGQVGNELGVDAQPRQGFDTPLVAQVAAELPVELLDTRIDIGAVEGGDAGVESRQQVPDRLLAIDCTMTAGELPATANDARDLVARREAATLHGQAPPDCGRRTAVVAACEKRRLPSRTIRSLLEQLGSGQATSLSDVIQSLRWVGRCFAASSGRTAAME